jgi:hypothetical protein
MENVVVTQLQGPDLLIAVAALGILGVKRKSWLEPTRALTCLSTISFLKLPMKLLSN